MHTSRQPTRPACPACRRPDISTRMPCAAASTRECPAPVRAAEPRVAGARAPPLIRSPVGAAARRLGASTCGTATGTQQPAVRCRSKKEDAPVSAYRLHRRFSARRSGPRKIDGTVALIARQHTRAPGAHCCTHMTAKMSERRHGVHARQRGRAGRTPRLPGERYLADRIYRLAVLGRLVVLITRPAPRPSPF